MLDYIKTMAIIITFIAGIAAIAALLAECRHEGFNNNQYDNQF